MIIRLALKPYTRVRRPRNVEQVSIFVSSSDEVKDHRRFFKAMEDGVRRALRENYVPVDLVIETWEGATAAKVRPGQTGNERFVELACEADVTCCILATELRPGTKEELEAALVEDDVDLAILVCVDQDDDWPDALDDFIRGLIARDVAFVAKVGQPHEGHGVRQHIVQVILRRIFEAIPEREEPRERR